MTAKTEQLQIRVTPQQKAELRRLAKGAGMEVSGFVLARALPARGVRFRELIRMLANEVDQRFALAEIHDLLAAASAAEYASLVEVADLAGVPTVKQNYLAALVEQGANRVGRTPPEWTRSIEPLHQPYFATPMKSLRVTLLRSSPAPFKRRNIFIEPGPYGRV